MPTGGRVLVVDADPAFTRAVQRTLAKGGYVVDESNDPRDALVLVVRNEGYDVILFDVGAPHVGPVEFHARVMAIDPALAARIVLVTPEPIEIPILNPQIVKPFGADDLRAWVDEFVTLRTVPPLRRSQLAP